MLFTLEKLVYKVVKQMQTLLSDELTHKLFELYQYEQARGCNTDHCSTAILETLSRDKLHTGDNLAAGGFS